MQTPTSTPPSYGESGLRCSPQLSSSPRTLITRTRSQVPSDLPRSRLQRPWRLLPLQVRLLAVLSHAAIEPQNSGTLGALLGQTHQLPCLHESAVHSQRILANHHRRRCRRHPRAINARITSSGRSAFYITPSASRLGRKAHALGRTHVGRR